MRICTIMHNLPSQSGENHLGNIKDMIFASKSWLNIDSLICKTSLVPCLWKQKTTSNPTTGESQTGAKKACSKSIGFRKLQFQVFHPFQIILKNINESNQHVQNVSRCVNLMWEQNKKTSNRINLQVCPELSPRLLREDQMARGEFEFASALGNWKTKCHESPWNFFMSFSERKLLIVSCCPPKNPRSGRF